MRARSRIETVALAILATGIAAVVAVRAEVVPEPVPPPPPEMPPIPWTPKAPSDPSKGFLVKEGEVHDGSVWEFTPSVVIAGTQKGNLHVWTGPMQIPGKVVGNIQAAAGSTAISGTVEGNVTVAGGSAAISGTINGNLKVYGGSFVLGPSGRVTGDLDVFTSQMTIAGTVDGDFTCKGGQVVLDGRVGDDASIECDTFVPGDGARIEGDLRYRSRNKPDFRGKEVVGGTIVENDAGTRTRAERRDAVGDRDEDRDAHPVAWWILRFVFDLLCGFLGLWAFRRWVGAIHDAVKGDSLRSLGVGFVTVLVVIAVNLSAILIVTIPFVLLFDLLAALVFLCLAKVPVFLWFGRVLTAALGRDASGTYGPFAAGTLVLCLLMALPYIGGLLWFVVSLLGLGAIVSGIQRVRLERKLARAAAAASAGPTTAIGA